MASVKEIAWVAGILEGEGCFFASNKKCLASAVIALVSTDLDVILKFKEITKCQNQVQISRRNSKYWKTSYKILVSGNLSIQWMMTIYSLMGTRRKEKIAELLSNWERSLGSGAPGRLRVIKKVG